MTNIQPNKTYIPPYNTPACSTPLESSLWEPSHWTCQDKIKLGQSSQIKQMYAIQTMNVIQSEIPALIFIATNKVLALRLAENND